MKFAYLLLGLCTVALIICIMKVATAALDKALDENADIEDISSSYDALKLPVMANKSLDLQSHGLSCSSSCSIVLLTAKLKQKEAAAGVEGGRAKRIVKDSPPPPRGCSWPGTYRTYADAVRSQQVPVEERIRSMKPHSMAKKDGASPKGVLEMVSRVEDRVWLKGSYIGVVHPSVDLTDMQNQLSSSNKFGCEIRPLGGREKNGLVEVLRYTIPSRTKTRSCLLFARILVHTTQLKLIDERMNTRVDGVLLQIRVSEEMVSSEEWLYSEVAASDGCKKIYPTLSLVVRSSPSHVEESIFNDQKESPAKPFPGMDSGINTKQHVTHRKQRAQNRCSEKAEGDRSELATEKNSRNIEFTGDGVYRANIYEREVF
ncbi:hypothetical protein Ancab_019617 [Ancistrocladus abbreviatus]